MPTCFYAASLRPSQPNRFTWLAIQDCRLDRLTVADDCCHDYDIRQILVDGQDQILAPQPATLYANRSVASGMSVHMHKPLTKGSLVEIVVSLVDPRQRRRHPFRAALIVSMEKLVVPCP